MRGKSIRRFTKMDFPKYFAIVCALVLGMSGCWFEAKAASEDVIKIGALYPFSGSLAVMGNEAFMAADIGREYINEQGGVLGKKVEFVKVDAPNPAAATNETQRFINQEKVRVIFGSYSSSISLAASPVAEKNGVVWWEMGSWDINITGRGYKNVYRASDNSETSGLTMADFATHLARLLGKDVKDLKVALVHEDSATGTTVIGKTVKTRAEELGMKIVAVENYNAKTGDLTSLILKLKSLNPDVVLQMSYLNDAILYWNQARELHFRPKAQVFSAGIILTDDFGQAQRNYADGLFDVGAGTLEPSSLNEEARKLVDVFLSRWRTRTGFRTAPPTHAARGFSNAYIFLKYILPKAGSLDSDKIRNAVMSLDMPYKSTILGWGVKFAPNGQNERVFAQVWQWQSGDKYLVWPLEFATRKPIHVPLPPWK